jgi:hypothetical protein
MFASAGIFFANNHVSTLADNVANIVKYQVTAQKNIELNILLPEKWNVKPRKINEPITVYTDSNNYISLQITPFSPSPFNTTCFKTADYKKLDSKLLRRQTLNNNPNLSYQEYLFYNTKQLNSNDNLSLNKSNIDFNSPVLLDYTTINQDLEQTEVLGSKAFYMKSDDSYVNILPNNNEKYDICTTINSQGVLNVSDNLQYIIKSATTSPVNQDIIDKILITSNLGHNLIPDTINQNSPIVAITNTVAKEERSNIYIFLTFFTIIGLFSILLVYMTRVRR